MQTFHDLPTPPIKKPTFLTIGNFDGVHLGHQRLIINMVTAARETDGLAGLLTFDPHPLTVLRPDVSISQLTSTAERSEILTALGLDFLVILPFSRDTAKKSAHAFIQDLLTHISVHELWIGPDFALGRGREGDVGRLRALGEMLGFSAQVIPPFTWRGTAVSSSRVRGLLTESGDVAPAAELLGRPYQIWGKVYRGAQRGRTIGFPTANLAIPDDRLTPAFGVYACWAWREDRGYPAVVNVGVRPSFDNGPSSIEAFLIDFNGDLYGESMGLSFVQRLRGEKRFADIAALTAQIGRDVTAAREILAHPPDHSGGTGRNSWRELPHTADWSIQVAAGSQKELFARTAAVMFKLQDADPNRPVTLARAITLTADNLAELLVGWLNELLLNQEVGEEMHTRYEIMEISGRGMRAVVYGYTGTPAHTAIKAATFYDLDVVQTPAGWAATVTFDV